MRAKSMILFVIAVGCGLAASIGVSQYMETAGGNAPPLETAKIFVAITDINIGDELNAQNIKLEEWPRDRVPDGAITELEEIEGKFTGTRLYIGEPILQRKLMDSNNGSKTVDIPAGHRAFAVKVDAVTGGGGLIQPGDRVDLIVFLRKGGEVPETGARTILRDVTVFSVDGATERLDGDDGPKNLRTVSLVVTPEQVEAVMLASELGTLSLSLRRPDDETEDSADGETVQSLLSGEGGSNDGSDFVDWLNKEQEEVETEPQPEAVAVPEAKWTMRIMGPDGYREFKWSDENELPIETTALEARAEPTPPTIRALEPATGGEPIDGGLLDDLGPEPAENYRAN